jgi:predicted acetyltransferase
MTLRLVPPSVEGLPGYSAALERGWSPDTTRDVSGEQLALWRRSPDLLIDELTRQDGTIRAASGELTPRLPNRVFWLDDGEFCGSINLRFVAGSDELPPHINGHVGYAVVPWKRRRGYAKHALALALPEARDVGLPRICITCYEDNEPSRRVIEANGGVLAHGAPAENGKIRLSFWIDLG